MRQIQQMEKNYDEDIMCLPDRHDTGLDIWRSDMAVSSGADDWQMDIIFGKDTSEVCRRSGGE